MDPDIKSGNNSISNVTDQLVVIPDGEIVMRDDRTGKAWKVAITPFLMGRFPVTQDLYQQVTGKNPSGFRNPRFPVETVSWTDAVRFCNHLSGLAGFRPCYALNQGHEAVDLDETANGFRLPTEAEWEFACKAGTHGPRYGKLDQIAWYRNNAENSPHKVGLKEPNAWGLYDMIGNVWEWCSDTYDSETYGSYRIFRGGGWNDEDRGCLATNRRRSHPVSFRIDDLGFRLARNSNN